MHPNAHDRLIDLIHDAPFDRNLWVPVMEQLCDAVGGGPACFTELDMVTGGGRGLSARSDPDSVPDYFANWTANNPLLLVDDIARYQRDWSFTILRDREWMPRDQLERTAYYNEFLRPLGAEQSIMIRLDLVGTVVTCINVARATSRGAFEAESLATARRYQEHMIRAVRTERRLGLTQGALDRIDVLLEHAPQALLFAATDGTVRQASAAAERLLGAEDMLSPTGTTFRNLATAEQAALDRLLAGGSAGGTIRVTAPRSGRPFTVAVAPLGSRGAAAQGGEPISLVTVTPAEPEPTVSAPELQARFGLTAAEARVALAIGDGGGVRAVADRLGVSPHTVRAQLAAVFGKTGCRRQADLVRLVVARGGSA